MFGFGDLCKVALAFRVLAGELGFVFGDFGVEGADGFFEVGDFLPQLFFGVYPCCCVLVMDTLEDVFVVFAPNG